MARVLVVSFSVVPGPDRHGVQLLHVLKALASRFAVDVLTLRVGDLAYVERFHKTRMLRVPLPDAPLGQQVDAFRRALRRQLEGAEYEIVHFRDAWSGIPIVEKQRAFGLRTVFDMGRSTLGEPRPADVKLAADLEVDEERCWKKADLVIVPSEAGWRTLAERGRVERVAVVPPGVDVDRFDSELPDVTGPPRVVCVGMLARGRGVRVLLRAMRDVVAVTPARLTLVGPIEKDFVASLESAIRMLGLAEHVETLGPVDNEEMPRVLSRAAVCVVAAWPDAARPAASFPTRILEYMACRRATVAPRRAAIAEVITDNEDGLLFEPGNPRDLGAKIARLLLDAQLRERLAEAAHRRVRSRFPASASRMRLLEAYALIVPISSWNPLGASASPINVPSAGVETDLPSGFLEDVTADTSPELEQGEPLGDSTTAVTVAAVDGGRAEGELDAVLALTVPDTEPWIVVTASGQSAEIHQRIAGVAPAASVPVAAGEEHRQDKLSVLPLPGPTSELDEGSFVAASDLLGAPGAPVRPVEDPPKRPTG